MNYPCKTIITGCLLIVALLHGKAQTIVHIGAGGQMYIGGKTAVSFDRLVMAPASNGFLLGENDISKLATPINPYSGNYLPRVYCFSHPVTNYSGSLAIFYNDKEAEYTNVNRLLMQAYTGYAWYPLKDNKGRNARRNGAGVTSLRDLSFSELLLGFTGDPDSRMAPIALAPAADASLSVALYPNPAVSTINIRVSSNSIIQKVKVFDASGKLLMVKEGSNSNVYRFNVSSLPSGFFMMAIETNSGKLSKGFIKQ